MKTWLNLANIIALLCLLFFIDSGHKEVNLYRNVYNEMRLSKATEYATDAAFFESVNAKDQNLDYIEMHATNMVNAEVNPSKTLETFDIVMAMNYDMGLEQKSYEAIEDSIGAAILVGKDGYYNLTETKTGENETGLRWSPKLPYTIEAYDGAGKKVATFAVTLNTQEYISIDSNGKVKTGKNYAEDGILTEEMKKTAISQTLTDAIALAMDNNSTYSGETEKSIYIPATQTFNGINDITTPTLLVLIRDADYAGVKGAQKAAFTGIKTIRQIRVITYYDNDGILKYCYEFQGAGDDKEIVNYYDTVESAAEAGALPDYKYLFNEIDYDGSSEAKQWN